MEVIVEIDVSEENILAMKSIKLSLKIIIKNQWMERSGCYRIY